MQTQPIGVKCPRCADDITCTVEVKLLTGHRTEMRLVDLADRFAEHYRDAGHVPTLPELVKSIIDKTRSGGPNPKLPNAAHA